jgi:hypothetical protein
VFKANDFRLGRVEGEKIRHYDGLSSEWFEGELMALSTVIEVSHNWEELVSNSKSAKKVELKRFSSILWAVLGFFMKPWLLS